MSNREIYKWNPVYNYIMKIKDKAIQKHIDICNPNISFKDIVKEVGTETEIKMAEILQFNRYKDFILIRYGSYADILSGEIEITMDNMWDIYDGFYRECRSLVVDIRNEIIVLSPFKKFRNLNEGQENTIENVNRMISTCKSFDIVIIVPILTLLEGLIKTSQFLFSICLSKNISIFAPVSFVPYKRAGITLVLFRIKTQLSSR